MDRPFISKIRCYSPNLGNKTSVRNYNYLYYIATREGVDLSNLSEENTIFETGYREADNQKYLKYIHERPKSNGLFGNIPTTDINGLCNDIKNISSKQPVYRCIFSLSESDASRLGYNTKAKWKNLLDDKLSDVGYELGINPVDLVWVSAFHNEKSHPHVHCMLWSKSSDYSLNPYISIPKQHKCREILSKQVFKEDYELHKHQKNAFRNLLIDKSKAEINAYLSSMKNDVSNLSLRLSSKDIDKLSKSIIKLIDTLPTKGNLMYKYLPEDSKKSLNYVLQEFLEIKHALKTAYDNYINEYIELSKIYSPTKKELEIATLKAKKDIDSRLYNIILKAVKNSQRDESSFCKTIESLSNIDNNSSIHNNNKLKEYSTSNLEVNNYELVKLGIAYLYGRGSYDKDVQLGLEYINKAIANGSAFASQFLDSYYGMAHLYGRDGLEKNFDLGYKYLNSAIMKGSEFAATALDSYYGVAHLYGRDGFEKDLNLGLKYLNKAKNSGSKYAEEVLNTYMGVAYLYGRMGMKKDTTKGIEYLDKAKKKGSEYAEEVLNIYKGVAHLYGRDGFDKNTNLGLEYLNKAKNNGSSYADETINIYLGIAYISGKDGYDKNTNLGLEYLNEAKKNGSSYAVHAFNHYFGIAYLYGRDGYDKNVKLGLEYLNKAKNEGSKFAAEMVDTYLGVSYLYGKNEFNKNVTLGLDHLNKAKDAGSAFASEVLNTYLGVAYLHGKDGFNKDVKLGLEYLNKAKDNGSKYAEEVLNIYFGIAYLYGKDGYDKDTKLGLEYLNKAKDGGSAFADGVINSYNSFIENRVKSQVYTTVENIFNSIIISTKANRIFLSNYDAIDNSNIKLKIEKIIQMKGKRDNTLHDYSLDR